MCLYEQETFELLKDGIDLITDADKALSDLLSYPLYATLERWFKVLPVYSMTYEAFVFLVIYEIWICFPPFFAVLNLCIYCFELCFNFWVQLRDSFIVVLFMFPKTCVIWKFSRGSNEAADNPVTSFSEFKWTRNCANTFELAIPF